MSSTPDPRLEHPSTYIVQDRSNQEEVTRLQVQDQMFTAGMGGVLPEQPDPTIFHRLLDVGCGPGGWLIETARTYSNLSMGIGIDASPAIIKAARQSAQEAGVSDRVEFHVMDALRMLEFPDSYFDLVNQRFGQSWLRTWDWQKLLQEYQRVTLEGGVIRITESAILIKSTSPALTRLFELGLHVLNLAGHLFGGMNEKMDSELARMFEQRGLQNIHTKTHLIEYSGETLERRHFVEDMKHLFRTTLPFIHKWTSVPGDFEETYRQMLWEIQQPDFVATARLHTIWGTN